MAGKGIGDPLIFQENLRFLDFGTNFLRGLQFLVFTLGVSNQIHCEKFCLRGPKEKHDLLKNHPAPFLP